MNIAIILVRYILIFIASLFVSAVLGKISWQTFTFIFQESNGSWLDFSAIAGSILVYAFIAPALACVAGEKKWLWALIIYLLPLISFQILSGFSYSGIFLLLITLGLVVGYGSRLLIVNIFGKMSRFESWKKYF